MFSEFNGNFYQVQGSALIQKLEPGNYTLNLSLAGFFLSRTNHSYQEKKIYGSIPQKVNRVLYSFEDRPQNTGVLISGTKGTGKTEMSEMICQRAIQTGAIVIRINQAFAGTNFEEFIKGINQPKVIFIDEFEKRFKNKENDDGVNVQESLLSLMSSQSDGKTLWLFTSNNHEVNEFMMNRPGRILYHFKFDTLETAIIEQYCEEKLKNQEKIEQLLQIASIFDCFSFDMLQAIVEEMNRFNESAKEAIEYLNMKPSWELNYKIIDVLVNQKHLNTKQYENFSYYEKFNAEEFEVRWTLEKDWINSDKIEETSFFGSDCISIDSNKVYTYQKKEDKNTIVVKVAPIKERRDIDIKNLIV